MLHSQLQSCLTSLALVAAMAAGLSAAQTKASLTNKQVASLIETAKSPANHARLANHYKAQAARLEMEAKDHDELAAAYRKSTQSQGAALKVPMAPNTAAHCEYIAKSIREAAKGAMDMASSHEQMAKGGALNK